MSNTKKTKTLAVPQFSLLEKTLAWSVHFLTASGVMAAFMSIVTISQGEFREAMLWLFLAFVIDGIDGSFARRWRVKEVLPLFSGQNMDYVIDFATYAIIPAYFVYEAQLVPSSLNLLTVAAILYTSVFYYGKLGMVSDDLHFIGFPVLWNFVIFYLFFVWDLGEIANFIAIIFLCILHFVPIKFLYPSRTEAHFKLTLSMTSLALISSIALLYIYPENNKIFSIIASLVVAYFSVMTIYKTYFYKTK